MNYDKSHKGNFLEMFALGDLKYFKFVVSKNNITLLLLRLRGNVY